MTVAMALLVLGLPRPAAAAPGPDLAWLEDWSTVFAGRPVRFRFRVASETGFSGLAGWALTIEHRTVARREVPVALAPGGAETVPLLFELPPERDGVCMPATLSCSVFTAGAPEPLQTVEKEIRLFPDDPFHERRAWLASIRFRLFDPEQTTGDILAKAGIDFQPTRNVAGLKPDPGTILILGAGTAFRDWPGLFEACLRLAAAGQAVLCLAPGPGLVPLPGSADTSLPRPLRLRLRQADVITELDKRLDADAWAPDGTMIASTFRIGQDGGRVTAEFGDTDTGWPWLEADYPGGGRLLVCGFAIIRKWDASPTPRFLFARILERLRQDTAPTLVSGPTRPRPAADATW